MNALLAVESHRSCDAAGAFETSRVLVTRVRAVHAAKSVHAGGGDDGVHHRVPAVAGIERIVLVEFTNRGRGHAHRRSVVARTEHEPLEPRRRAGNLTAVKEPACGLDLSFDPDPTREPDVRLDLRQERVNELD